MAGCDGRMKSRSYYTEDPADTGTGTKQGCAKYRYNKLPLHINGIPRVLDAGQCNEQSLIGYNCYEVVGSLRTKRHQ